MSDVWEIETPVNYPALIGLELPEGEGDQLYFFAVPNEAMFMLMLKAPIGMIHQFIEAFKEVGGDPETTAIVLNFEFHTDRMD